ncbi:signal peptidase complex-like protein DTM1 [Phalaenopsis equestris]|uniref:signal peptidase complex-like protein DTM1 n=1 Tax=Phalaenopsis equestris TaxID=78828 RepID=UPI0009E46559|nr:signal peptidase complex-like protein DTM1 [Phalaenopsis equestris]
MDNDAALRSCLVALAALMVVVGLCSFSLKKVLATYAYGILGIAGLLLPDWEFFDRDYSQWFTPMTVPSGPGANRIARAGRFKFHPLRVALLSAIYCFGLYKWWKYVSS